MWSKHSPLDTLHFNCLNRNKQRIKISAKICFNSQEDTQRGQQYTSVYNEEVAHCPETHCAHSIRYHKLSLGAY